MVMKGFAGSRAERASRHLKFHKTANISSNKISFPWDQGYTEGKYNGFDASRTFRMSVNPNSFSIITWRCLSKMAKQTIK